MSELISELEERVKYRIEGEFCANCSAKMERMLSATEGIGETTINYATKTVVLPPSRVVQAQEIMEKIEAGVKLVPIHLKQKVESPDNTAAVNKENQWRITRIMIACALFAVGLVFESRWKNSSWEVMEYLVYLTAYFIVGYKVLAKAVRNIFRGQLFDENFLMSLATVGAIAIHALPEAVAVMLFYSVGEYLEERAVNRSRNSIQALLNFRPEYANLVHQLDVIKVDPEEVQVGQQILVRPGEKVPLDGEIVNGNSFVDTSALTGESVPRKVQVGNPISAGMINTTGVLTVRVTKVFAESSVQKILDLVENASTHKATTEKFITTFARFYTPAVVVAALGIALVPPLLSDGNFQAWLYRALTILVISCPCALVISVPLGYFGGIGGASRHGILIKGANYLEALTDLRTVVFDKTGTLTEGVFQVVEISPAKGYTERELLEIAASAEAHSPHPIAKSIREKYGKDVQDSALAGLLSYEEVRGQGIRASYNGQTVLVGKAELLEQVGISIPRLMVDKGPGTVVYISVDGGYVGQLTISDRVKADSPAAIARLNQMGMRTVMLTGDNQAVAKAVAEELAVSEYHSDLMPEDKVSWLETLSQAKRQGKIAFIGDGLNDAPVLTRADVGIAMGGLGSDAAIEAADVVIMDDQPSKLVEAIQIARYTKTIIWQNIGFALGVKLLVILLAIFGMVNMWMAIFADEGVALLAIMNAMRVRWYHKQGHKQGDRFTVPASRAVKVAAR
ncbi:heavy metal translocating P-type ATPase [Desulfosporosinus metallidurans]|uniref:Cd(2+)-exporting ATPase n=1 Tax=Desulfosporosinus metallidurans TaxID=1888891 RepID=A0A1Q8R0Q8_9FIRM|nr:heavy metal translocating P-type ATPase [Desulfosporosinus metallidurans]OLN33177.1 Lead, cadmium, zinc and mercury transporting ATPase [Desulfosporosinus metallidurans]